MEIEKTDQHSKIDDFTIIKTLGAGVSAKVKLAYKEDPKNKVAIKVFKEQFSDIKLLQQEIVILKNLNHPNLVNMIKYNLFSKYQSKQKCKEPKTIASITMQFVSNGELFDFITLTGRFSERICRYYFSQLMDAVDYLHKNGLAHRDLKPDNLLLDDEFNLKVTDFGMTGFLKGSGSEEGKMQTYCGTLDYMAPQIIMKKEYDGKAVDLFAAAQILFILLTGIPPFPTAALTDQFYLLIYNNKIEQFWTVHTQFQAGQNVTFSPEFKELVTPLWSFDPSKRHTSEQIRASAWFKQEAATKEEVLADFNRRRELIVEEKEKQRMLKLEQKGIATGGFRSTVLKEFQWKNTELSVEDELLEELFQVSKERKPKKYSKKEAQKSDIISYVDAASLLKYLLVAQSHIGDEVELDANFYELTLQVSDSENPEFPIDYHYSISLCKNQEKEEGKNKKEGGEEDPDNDEIFVQFQFIQGDYLEYLLKVEEIRSEISQL